MSALCEQNPHIICGPYDNGGCVISNTPCGKPAVIRYDGMNRCKDHADKNVLALYKVLSATIGQDRDRDEANRETWYAISDRQWELWKPDDALLALELKP